MSTDTLQTLESIIRDRQAHPTEGSYTCHLFAEGRVEIAKKVGEEAIEVIVAATSQGTERLVAESADLLYHLMVLLVERGVSWQEVVDELARRRK